MPYNPSQQTVSNKSYAPAQAVPTDSRSFFYDASLFVLRPYQSTAEVLAYLDLAKYRSGNFPIFINDTGTLSGAVFTGGVIKEFWFKNGVTDGDLVEKYNSLTSLQQAIENGNYLSKDNTIHGEGFMWTQNNMQFTNVASGAVPAINLAAIATNQSYLSQVYLDATTINAPNARIDAQNNVGGVNRMSLDVTPTVATITKTTAGTAAPPRNIAVSYDNIYADTSGKIPAPFKVYTAILNQGSAAAPSVAVQRNTLPGTVVWTRVSAGIYQATLRDGSNNLISGGFGSALVMFLTAPNSAVYPADTNNLKMTIFNGSDFVRINTFVVTISGSAFVNTYSDDILRDSAIELRIYG